MTESGRFQTGKKVVIKYTASWVVEVPQTFGKGLLSDWDVFDVRDATSLCEESCGSWEKLDPEKMSHADHVALNVWRQHRDKELPNAG
jgi:hypothetical protein